MPFESNRTQQQTDGAARTGEAPPRADGAVLHVDFEHYEDGLVGPLNAGVRWVGDPFATNVKQKVVEITRDPATAFAGARCGHVLTDQDDQRGQIVLLARYDAPGVEQNAIAEFVFRAASPGESVQLRHFMIFSAVDEAGVPVGLILRGESDDEGTYRIDVENEFGDRTEGVIVGLKPQQWIRIILYRRTADATVDLWNGPPDGEKWIGTFPDLNPQGQIRRIEIGDLDSTRGFGSGYWDDVRVGKQIPPGGAVAPAERVIHVGQDPPRLPSPIVVAGSEKQLFVDDVMVQSMRGLTRTFHPLIKHAHNPVLKPQTPYEIECRSLLPLTVLRDGADGAFRCWYAIWGKQVGKTPYEALAESRDGLTWTRQNLGIVEHQGDKENNFIRPGRMFRVLHDPAEADPNRRYKAAIRDAGFLACFSPDGLHWKAGAPILDQAYDASSVGWDPVGRKWIASCKIWKDSRRARGYAESRDFVNWTDTYYQFAADELDGPQDQTYYLSIDRYQSVYVGLLKMYHLDSDRCDVQIAFSRDGKHWQRPCRVPFIPSGDNKTDWDHGNVDPVSAFHAVGDELWFYYSGRRTLHNELPNDGAMGLGRLRLDGFASLDAADNEGVLITCPLVLKGRRLLINADVLPGGSIHVEILDARQFDATADEPDVPMFPFTRENCAPITTDGVAHVVDWQNAPAGLSSLRGRAVRLRFTMNRVRLYAFWAA